jgi:hypothetical protein
MTRRNTALVGHDPYTPSRVSQVAIHTMIGNRATWRMRQSELPPLSEVQAAINTPSMKGWLDGVADQVNGKDSSDRHRPLWFLRGGGGLCMSRSMMLYESTEDGNDLSSNQSNQSLCQKCHRTEDLGRIKVNEGLRGDSSQDNQSSVKTQVLSVPRRQLQ